MNRCTPSSLARLEKALQCSGLPRDGAKRIATAAAVDEKPGSLHLDESGFDVLGRLDRDHPCDRLPALGYHDAPTRLDASEELAQSGFRLVDGVGARHELKLRNLVMMVKSKPAPGDSLAIDAIVAEEEADRTDPDHG